MMISHRVRGLAGYGVQYSPFFDDKIAVCGGLNFGLAGNGLLSVFDVDAAPTDKVVFETQDAVFALSWSEVHENHIVAGTGDGSLKLFDIASQSQFPIMAMHEHSREVFGVNWSMVDKQHFASCSWDGTIKIWSFGHEHSMQTFGSGNTAPGGSPDTHCVYQAKFSPHVSGQLASAHSDGSIRTWDTRIGVRPPAVYAKAHLGEVLSLDWNRYRPEILASASVDGSIKIWDLRKMSQSPTPVAVLRGHDLAVRSIAWSPHFSDTLLSTSYDCTARVWRGSQEQFIFNKHSEFVVACDWSLWGEPGWVATAGWDEMVYIWNPVK